MNQKKLDALLWENIPFSNFICAGNSEIKQYNIDDVSLENVDELCIKRDDEYNLNISCISYLNHYKNTQISKKPNKAELSPGESIPQGKLTIKLFDGYTVNFEPIYCNGYESKMDQTNYKLSCYHVKGYCSSKKVSVIKEWVINGCERGLNFCGNTNFEYKVEGSVYGSYGEMEFPVKELLEEKTYMGRIVHIEYKDTAFDVHYVGNNYGPKWSTNLSISYFEKYGRIPNEEERRIIRDYLSFFIGKKLIYIGESSFDENGNQIGFIMEHPKTYGFDIKKICKNGAKPPIRDKFNSLQNYFNTIQRNIDAFSEIYSILDFESLFSSYWYAKEIAKPMDLPILAGSLENLMKKWYEKIDSNPETVLMDKKDFTKKIKPLKELVVARFEGTEYIDRMKRSIEGMNRMTVNERISHFFDALNLELGTAEKKALKARNFSAHGSYGEVDTDYQEMYITSQVYECIIVRVVLSLLHYDGNYIDYGTIGYPEKDISVPSGINSDDGISNP